MLDSPSPLSAPRTPTFDVFGWILRLGACILFVNVGLSKFEAHSMWVQMFEKIGLGVWFRYLTGALQVAGGLLFLIPRAVYPAAVLTGGTMIGAMFVHMFVLGTGVGGAIIPFAVLIFVIVVARHRAA